MSSASYRREEILEILNARRFETMDTLARELNVSRKTIYRDIVALSYFAPVYTVNGRFGGVHVPDDFVLSKKFLSEEQETELLNVINGNEVNIVVIQSIIASFSKMR